MNTITNSRNPDMLNDRIAGAILIASALLMVFAMLHHPVPHAHSFEELVQEMDSLDRVNQLVHGSAIALMMLLSLGMSFFGSRLGLNRVTVRAALIAFFVGAFAMIIAAMFSGFIVPDFLNSATAAAHVGSVSLNTLRSINQCFDLLGVTSLSSGVFLFGVAALTSKQRLWLVGSLGLATGMAGCLGIFTGHTQANVQGVIGFALLLAVWLIAVGIQLIKPRTTPEG